MYHALARLGRSKFGTYFMPALTTISTVSMVGFQSFGHDLVEKLFGSSNPDGSPMKICDHLRNMITEVYDEALKCGWHADSMSEKLKTFEFPDPPVRWFASATIDPFVLGMADYATGITIAVPSHYNYQKKEDLPDNLFEIKKISLFKSLRLTDQEKDEETQEQANKELELVRNSGKGLAKTIFRIDKNSETGKEYIDSLVLSDNAKRYSIAKELFVADTYKPFYKVTAFFSAMLLASSLARSYVMILKLKDAHVSQRIPGYMVSGIFAYGFHYVASATIDNFCSSRAHKRVIEMGEQYKEGCQEYNRKLITRNKILKIRYNYLYEPTHKV